LRCSGGRGNLRRGRFRDDRRRGQWRLGPARRRARREQGRSLIVVPRRRQRAVDLRFDQNVVRAADHDQMLDVVAPDEHQLPLAVETECVDEAEPRLTRSTARNAQPMGEHKSVEDRQDDKRGDAARHQETNLNDPIIRERKLFQPLHA
jgi:hypothetical protein